LDEHVDHAIARALERRGIEAVTASDTGAVGLPDTQLLARCLAEGRVLVTHDRDFLRLHHQGMPHAGIAYCDHGIRSIGELVEFLVLAAEVFSPDEMSGRLEYM
jgi:hypothetical protein